MIFTALISAVKCYIVHVWQTWAMVNYHLVFTYWNSSTVREVQILIHKTGCHLYFICIIYAKRCTGVVVIWIESDIMSLSMKCTEHNLIFIYFCLFLKFKYTITRIHRAYLCSWEIKYENNIMLFSLWFIFFKIPFEIKNN